MVMGGALVPKLALAVVVVAMVDSLTKSIPGKILQSE
jgi:hypothetical protein